MNQERIIFGILLCTMIHCAAKAANDPCKGTNELLLIVNRPTAGISTCVVPEKKALGEFGYQYLSLIGGGDQQNFPQPNIRLGVYKDTELFFQLPNYVHQNVIPFTGYQSSAIGMKYRLGYTSKWVTSIVGAFSPPSGSTGFGNEYASGFFNGIISYNLTSSIGAVGILGVSSVSAPAFFGGQRTTSVNPDVVMSFTKDNYSIYGEIYGQSKTGFLQDSGFNLDLGILYLFKKNIEVDISVGQRLYGLLGNFNRYIEAGFTIEFG